ncbi:MAG TPA: serine protease [Acidobacteriota bacterium]|nr:serine protease [Acidobacteriota bacterium]
MTRGHLREIEKATVKLTKKRGQGVLVKGNCILTAAHCITYSGNGEMALGDYFTEDIQTQRGAFKASPLAVEPVSDIAVLGAVDGQATEEFFQEWCRFEDFCEKTKPVELCPAKYYKPGQSFKIWILTHTGEWVIGKATSPRVGAHLVFVEAEKSIKGGTSGGPIVNELGQLVGLVSTFGGTGGHSRSGPSPCPSLTLPVWILHLIA